MNCKIHVNINQGLFEAEGPEQFVLDAYKDFKESLTTEFKNPTTSDTKGNKKVGSITPSKQAAPKPAKKSQKKKSSSQSYTQVKDLDIFAKDNCPSLDNFLKGYDAGNSMKQLLLFTHYLKELKDYEVVSRDELYTCFKRLGITVPSINSTLNNTSHRKGWLDVSKIDDVKITIAGENAIIELAKDNSD